MAETQEVHDELDQLAYQLLVLSQDLIQVKLQLEEQEEKWNRKSMPIVSVKWLFWVAWCTCSCVEEDHPVRIDGDESESCHVDLSPSSSSSPNFSRGHSQVGLWASTVPVS